MQHRIVTSILLITTATVIFGKIMAHHNSHRSPTAGFIDDRSGLQRTSYDQTNQNSDSPASPDQDYAGGSTIHHDSAGSPTPDLSSWSRQTTGDRSTSVLLPPNWTLAGVASGSAEIKGPANEQVVLGYQTFVTPGTQDYAPYMEPERALDWFVQTHGSQLIRVLDREPAGEGNPGGEAEFITAEIQYEGHTYKAVALVRTNNMQMNTWTFQISYISAPEKQFDKEFPTMKGIWNNWKLDSGYVQNSFAHAGQIEDQTRSMVMAGAQHSMHAYDNVNEAWDQTIRGVSTMENTDTGRRAETQLGTEQQVLRDCQRRGINCREVPTNELVQPQ